MIITNANEGKKAGFSLKGTELTIGDVSIDLQDKQRTTDRVIDICLDNQLIQCVKEWELGMLLISSSLQKSTNIDQVAKETKKDKSK